MNGRSPWRSEDKEGPKETGNHLGRWVVLFMLGHVLTLYPALPNILGGADATDAVGGARTSISQCWGCRGLLSGLALQRQKYPSAKHDLSARKNERNSGIALIPKSDVT